MIFAQRNLPAFRGS